MTVHFWPGQGLNSGFKAGIALGDEIMHALNGGRFVGLELGAMKEYNNFIMKLQGREHHKRSIPIFNQSGSPEMLGVAAQQGGIHPRHGRARVIADRLERRDDWHFSPEANIEPQIRIVLRQMHSLTLREMAVSFPWPTREIAGAEVLPIRSMKPEEKQKWLQQLWGLLSVEKLKEVSAARAKSPGPPSTASNARFEAPRAPRGVRSPSQNPMARLTLNDRHGSPPPTSNGNGNGNLLDVSPSLRRSNAAKNSVRSRKGWPDDDEPSYNGQELGSDSDSSDDEPGKLDNSRYNLPRLCPVNGGPDDVGPNHDGLEAARPDVSMV
ncbi:hypothetical protein B0H66DRAFT_631409 [Apodospora peruviana]|uniref:Uncharacterized protein n=1 Tax=Apodospora peruviana TaxID=516989 RepID=A0AAE0HTN3_9PEZI|nr:hypothetical protein B0H66DRAFT_631409 [Apodospora peruviana]